MARTTPVVLFVVVGWVGGQILAQEQTTSSIPTLRFTETDTPPVIDGDLADGCWKNSAMLGGFVSTRGYWLREQTEGLVTYDDTHFYVGVRCYDRQIKSLAVKKRAHDDVLISEDDSIALCFDVNHDRKTFYRLIINSLGNCYEASVDAKGGGRDAAWNPDCRVAAAFGDKEWTIELAIPFASLGIAVPKPGTIWGFNLNREAPRSPHTESAGSWAMSGAFNDPMQFGEIIFGEMDPISSSFRFVHDYYGRAVIRTTVRNHTTSPIQLHMQILPELKPISETTLAPLEEKKIDLHRKMQSDDLQTAVPLTIRITDAKDESIYLHKTALVEIASALTFIPDLYYYPADCDSFLAQVSTLIGASVRLSISASAQGDALVEKTFPFPPDSSELSVAVPASDLGVGRYVLTAAVLDADGQELAQRKTVIYKTDMPAAKPIPSTVKAITFGDKGEILVNDTLFFPLLSTVPGGGVTPPSVTRNSFNVRWGKFGEQPTALRRVEAHPTKGGWNKGPTVGVYRIMDGEDGVVEERLRKIISENLGLGQGIFDWNIAYEAQIPMFRYSEERIRLDNPQTLRKFGDFIKSIDPIHPTSLHVTDAHSPPIASYKDSADIIGVSCYSSSYGEHLIPNLVDDFKKIRRDLGPAKPVLFWIGSGMRDERFRRPKIIRCAAYLAMMHGINGLVFHTGHSGRPPSLTHHWSVFPGLARETEFVYPILVSPDSPDLPTVAIEGGNLDFQVKRYNDRLYLIACNTGDFPTTPTVTFSGRGQYALMNLPLEHRQIALTDNAFSDEFMPYEVHVYEVVE
jgi:hypothetical protein